MTHSKLGEEMVGQTLEASFLFTNSYTSSFQTLGKVGTITKIDDDYDVTVKFGQSSFRYSPACCVPAPGATPDTVTATPGGEGEVVNRSRDEASSGKIVSRENSPFQMSLLTTCQSPPPSRPPPPPPSLSTIRFLFLTRHAATRVSS